MYSFFFFYPFSVPYLFHIWHSIYYSLFFFFTLYIFSLHSKLNNPSGGELSSVDVLDSYGILILRIATTFTVANLQFAGPDYKQLWLVGRGAVARVEWELQGLALK